MYHLSFILHVSCVLQIVASLSVLPTENVPVNVGLGCSYSEYPIVDSNDTTNSSGLLWSHTIDYNSNSTDDDDNTLLSLHFNRLHLPPNDYLLLKDGENNILANVSSTRASGISHDPFFKKLLNAASTLILELYTTTTTDNTLPSGCFIQECFGLEVDYIRKSNAVGSHETLCGTDGTVEAKCLLESLSKMYGASRPVARLLIHKEEYDAACTGFLFGCEGHLLTNHHCISSEYEALNTEFEFMAEGPTCGDDCTSYGGCPGIIESGSTVEFVTAVEELDFALVKLSANLPTKYGYHILRESAITTLGEQIYVPQHPLGHGKRVSYLDDEGSNAVVISLNKTQCNIVGTAYNADTQGGASGSPVISRADNQVVALHHCGSHCSNTGVPSDKIVSYLTSRNILPKCATNASFGTETRLDFTKPTSTTTLKTHNSSTSQVWTFSGTLNATHPINDIVFKTSDGMHADKVSLDILSVEISNDGEFFDLNRDCKATYVDTAMILLEGSNENNNLREIAYNDDAIDSMEGTMDGSVSIRDPYIQRILAPGTEYTIAIGAVPFSDFPPRSKNDVTSIYDCIADTAPSGAYLLTITSHAPLEIISSPVTEGVVTNTSCPIQNTDLCSF